MATQVNLSSREWCDLVFEGKNKDFGAYVIRTESTKRHNKAVLWTLIGTIIFGLIAFGFVKANQYLEEKKRATDCRGQECKGRGRNCVSRRANANRCFCRECYEY